MHPQYDKDLLGLASMVNSGIRQNLNSNKDVEVLNKSQLDINKFLPKNYRGPIPRSFIHHAVPRMPQHQSNYPEVPSPYNGGGNYSLPVNDYEPTPLPNRPSSLLPMSEEAMSLLNTPDEFVSIEHTNSSFNVPTIAPDISFKNTNFLSPTKQSKSLDSISEESVLDSLRREISEQKSEIQSLKSSIKTLNRNINNLIKQLKDTNNINE